MGKEFDVESIVGLTEEEATEKVEAAGMTWRVLTKDGVSLMVTRDLRNDRLNFSLVDGKITKAQIG